MANYAKETGPKTTIWREGADGLTLVATEPGLPYGTLTIGNVLRHPHNTRGQVSILFG